MKKYILLIGLMVFSLSISTAQKPNKKQGGDRAEMMEKIKAKKVAFLTTKMDLTSKESAAFWPIYNDYEKQMDELKSAYNKNYDFDSLTDQEIEKLILEDFEKKEKFLELHKEAFADYKKIIPVKKIAILKRAEREFTKEVLYRYKKRSEEHKKSGNRR